MRELGICNEIKYFISTFAIIMLLLSFHFSICNQKNVYVTFYNYYIIIIIIIYLFNYIHIYTINIFFLNRRTHK